MSQDTVTSNHKRRRTDTDLKDPIATPTTECKTHPPPVNFLEWINDNRPSFAPPVGNKLMYPAPECQFKIMLVGGPNSRTDYHVEEGEEWFYMVEGDMVLKIVDGGVFKDVVIREGEFFLLPANVPHSPQRLPNTIGLVIERVRTEKEMDTLRWYCQKCKEIVYQEQFHCVDLGSQLGPVIKKYYASEELRTCKACGAIDPPPDKSKHAYIPPRDKQPSLDTPVDKKKPYVNTESHPWPQPLKPWLEIDALAKPPVGAHQITGKGTQFQVMTVGENDRRDFYVNPGEVWHYQIKGDAELKVKNPEGFKTIPLKEGDSYLLPAGVPHCPSRPAKSVGLVVHRNRFEGEKDKVQWYSDDGSKTKEVEFECRDYPSQLKKALDDAA